MTASQIREIDARCLNDYLATIPASDHRFFVRKVVNACGEGVKQKTFYNWKAGCCCIPDFCKKIIERIAGCTVFPPELYDMNPAAAGAPRQSASQWKDS